MKVRRGEKILQHSFNVLKISCGNVTLLLASGNKFLLWHITGFAYLWPSIFYFSISIPFPFIFTGRRYSLLQPSIPLYSFPITVRSSKFIFLESFSPRDFLVCSPRDFLVCSLTLSSVISLQKMSF